MEESTNPTTPIENHNPDKESRVERLTNELADTNALIRHTFSTKMIIYRGVITGLAVVIGSTIIASILLSSWNALFGNLPIVQRSSSALHVEPIR